MLEFLTLVPTSFVVEFGGKTESKKGVFNAGTCNKSTEPETVTLPVDFFNKNDFPEPEGGALFGKIEDVVDPIGPVKFEVILDYDCGGWQERKSVPMGGQAEYCDIVLNAPSDG